MSRKKRLAWKPTRLVYNNIKKEVRRDFTPEDFDRMCDEISQRQAIVHLLLSRMVVDLEVISDDLKFLGAGNDDTMDAYASALKWVNRAIDLVETQLDSEAKKVLLRDNGQLDDALDRFLERHELEISPRKKRDMEYHARFAASKPYETVAERRAFEDGYIARSVSELEEAMELRLKFESGKEIFVEQSDIARWLEQYCRKNGVPSELIHSVEERQGV